MHPRLLFWIPAVLRTSLLLDGASLLWYWFGPIAGLSAALLAALGFLALQLHYLFQLANWLDDPLVNKLPDGWGAWTEIYSRLNKLRRDDDRNQKDLTEWLSRFRQAMNLLPDGVVIMDDVLFLEWCNPVAETHLGLRMDRDKGMRVTNLVRSPEFMDYIILGRYEQPLTMSFRDRKLIVHIIPIENRRQILVTHDATESERIERMRRDFIANASHELRTPLTVINGFLEIANHQPNLDQETRDSHLKLMAEQGKRMQNLVEDMLTLTQHETNEKPKHTEQVDMHALLEQLRNEALALSSGRHQISVEVQGADIKGSTEDLRSAFGNLVSNAVRYT